MMVRAMLRPTLFHIDDIEKQAELLGQKEREMSALPLLDDVKTYPPTYVYHGTADVLVDVSQSDRFVAKLKVKGVPVEYAKIGGGPHVCDQYEVRPPSADSEPTLMHCRTRTPMSGNKMSYPSSLLWTNMSRRYEVSTVRGI